VQHHGLRALRRDPNRPRTAPCLNPERQEENASRNFTVFDWPTVFANAACTIALIERLVHHSEIIITIEGKSYRAREAEEAKPARRKPKS
jgi:IstB-like ATP binding protein